MYDDFKGKSKKIKTNDEDNFEEDLGSGSVSKKDDDVDLGEGGIDESLIDEIFDDEGDTEDEDGDLYNEDEEDDWDNGLVEEDGDY